MYVMHDYIQNGQAYGEVAQAMSGFGYESSYMRPYLNENGKRVVSIPTGRMITNEAGKQVREAEEVLIGDLMADGTFHPSFMGNAATTLRKQEWEMWDQQLLRVARPRLKAWGDLQRAASFGGFDGMAKLVLEHETMSDPGEAQVDMDGLSEGRNDTPLYQLEGLPLPITHSSFVIPQRKLIISRNSGTPLDTTLLETHTRRVAEKIEKTLIGNITGLSDASGALSSSYSRTPTVYGYTNFPNRATKTDLTTPTGSNATATVDDVLEMRELLYDLNMFGPYMVYHSTDWDRFMDNDYAVTGGNNPSQTLRNRLRAIDGIVDVQRLDYLTDTFTLLLVQMTSDVARAVTGMPMTIVQWESKGGALLHFKIMCIMVPQLRADYSGQCGICHGTTA